MELTTYLLIENLPNPTDLSPYLTIEYDVHVNLIFIENNQLTLSYIDDRDDIFVDLSGYVNPDPVDLTPYLLIENIPSPLYRSQYHINEHDVHVNLFLIDYN